MDPKQVVAAGYDVMAERYLAWSGLRPSAARLRYLALANELIPAGASVLELGCGAGLPVPRPESVKAWVSWRGETRRRRRTG